MRPRRNLLIILAHGLRSDALSDEREWPLPTPHLVDLATRGVRLVSTSVSPTDPGSMMSAVSGFHARQHGAMQDATRGKLYDGLPQWLKDAGYYNVGVGEVDSFQHMLHEATVTRGQAMTPDPKQCWYAASAQARGHHTAIAAQRKQRVRTGPIAPDRLMLDPQEDIDGFIAEQAIEAMGRLPKDKPWAMFVVFSGPGNDLPPPLYFDDLISPSQLTRGFLPAEVGKIGALVEPDLPRSMLQNLEPHHIGRVRADYLGRVSLIDHCVGQLSEAAKKRNDSNHIWTMLGADRGKLLGEHGLLGHRSFLAGAVEVPLIVTPPRGGMRPADKFQDGLFSNVDFAATAAALAGVDQPAHAPGRSVLPIFQGNPVLPQTKANLSEYNDRVLVETERFKAIFKLPKAECVALFDMVHDPHENINIHTTKEGRAAATLMRMRLGELLLPLRHS